MNQEPIASICMQYSTQMPPYTKDREEGEEANSLFQGTLEGWIAYLSTLLGHWGPEYGSSCCLSEKRQMPYHGVEIVNRRLVCIQWWRSPWYSMFTLMFGILQPHVRKEEMISQG